MTLLPCLVWAVWGELMGAHGQEMPRCWLANAWLTRGCSRQQDDQ